MVRKADSAQKKRQRSQSLSADAIERRMVERVESIAALHGIAAVENEFAGYFNQLGFRIDVALETSAPLP